MVKGFSHLQGSEVGKGGRKKISKEIYTKVLGTEEEGKGIKNILP